MGTGSILLGKRCFKALKAQEGREEVLGTGMHGAVLMAKHRKSGRRVAAKCLEASEGNTLPEEAERTRGEFGGEIRGRNA